MLLKTFANSFLNASAMTNLEYYDGEPEAGLAMDCITIWEQLNAVYYGSSSKGWYMRLGTSNDPETYNTGSLVSPITALTNISITQAVNNVDIMRSVVLVVRNDTNSTITVREIGIGGNYRAGLAAIFARKVLDTPVEIEPGETYAFTYSIKLHT